MNRILLMIAIAIVTTAIQANAQKLTQQDKNPIQNSLAKVVALQPIKFSYERSWAEILGLKTSQQGFDLDQVAKSSPELLINQSRNYNSGKNNNKTIVVPKIDSDALIPLLVGSIKEQQQQIEALQAEIKLLKSKMGR